MELIFLEKLQQMNRRIILHLFSFNLSRPCGCSRSTPAADHDNGKWIPWRTQGGHDNLCLCLAYGKPQYNASTILSILADLSAEFLHMFAGLLGTIRPDVRRLAQHLKSERSVDAFSERSLKLQWCLQRSQ